jgi:hypothetical protein
MTLPSTKRPLFMGEPPPDSNRDRPVENLPDAKRHRPMEQPAICPTAMDVDAMDDFQPHSFSACFSSIDKRWNTVPRLRPTTPTTRATPSATNLSPVYLLSEICFYARAPRSVPGHSAPSQDHYLCLGHDVCVCGMFRCVCGGGFMVRGLVSCSCSWSRLVLCVLGMASSRAYRGVFRARYG